jgi:CBS domain-containing protein
MTIARLIEGRSGEVIGCSPEDSVGEAVALLALKRIGALPVVDGDRVLGIFSERDVVYRLAAEGIDLLQLRVGDVMTTPAVTVEASAGIMEALALMTKRRFRHLPVVEGERMVGFISIGDLVKYRIESIEAEAEAMRTYIQSA